MGMEASEVAVRVRLLGGSAFEKEAESVAGSVEGIGAAGKKADLEGVIGGGAAKASSKLDALGSKLKSFGKGVTAMGRALLPASIALTALGYYSVKAQSQFQSSMMLLYSQAGLPRKNLQALTNDVLNLSKAVGQTPNALAQGLFPIVSSGFHNPKTASGLLKLSGIMAAVGHDTVDNTANALTSIINTGFKPKGGASQIAAWLEATVGAGKMHLPDLTQAMGTSILPMVKMTGMQLPQILAASAALTREGVAATSVMSRMRLSLTSVTSPTAQGQKALAIMHFGKFSLANDLRKPGGLITMLQDLKLHTAKMGPDQRNNLIAEIFGKSRGIGNIGALLQSLPQMSQIYSQVLRATPQLLQKHFEGTKTTNAFKFSQLKAEGDTALIKLGQIISKDVLPILFSLVKALTGAMGWFLKLPAPLQKGIVLFGALIVVLAPILLVLGGLITAFGILLEVVGAVVGVVVAIGAAIGIATAVVILLVSAVVIVAFIFRRQLLGAIKSVAHALSHTFWKVIHDVVSIAKKLWDGLWKLGDIVRKVVSSLAHFAAKLLHTAESPIKSLLHIAGLASGGTVQSSGTVMVGERGPELLDLPRGATVTPLPTQGLSNLKAQFGDGTGNVNITVNTLLDGKVIATSVANVNRRGQNRK